ncbi:MAG: glycosyltransferase [Pseudomonadota bacterium]
MRILVSTVGSRGDVQPMLALALELQGRGHQLLFAAPPENQAWVEGRDLRFHAVGVDLMKAVEGIYTHRVGLGTLTRFVRDRIAEQFDDLLPLADAFDLYLGGGLQLALPSVAEARQRPYAYTAFSPCLLRSSQHAPVFFAAQRLPRWLNRILWAMYVGAGTRATRGMLGQQRHRLGLPPTPDIYRYMFEPAALLLAFDPVLGPLPDDVEARAVSTGFFFLDDDTPVPDAVSRFVAQGAAPLYVGQGSMWLRDAPAVNRVLLDVQQQLGCRLIVGRGRSGLGEGMHGEGVLVVDAVNHAALFPRCAAVVHHGGAGTTATALRAGVPQLVTPHSADQFYWARRVHELGLGPAPLAFGSLSTRPLVARLRAVLEDGACADRARVESERLAQTSGTAVAARALETLVEGGTWG